ncbi:MAG: sel1 repeat family protein [Hyphomicrobiales bacterium]|nr:sel1 repeat family protein [Hyphomicrobiales bacterium]
MYDMNPSVLLAEADAAYRRGDGPAAVELLLPLANRGNAIAQYFLGSIYDNGREGVERDRAEAVRWFRLAADQGDALAQASLGIMYSLGRGVPQDDIEAANWLLKSVYQGNMEAQGPLAQIYTRGLDSFAAAAEQGDAEAQFHLAVMIESGLAQERNQTEAVKWYRKAAEQGHAAAQSSLGALYSFGRGVTQDFAESAKWYRRAAEQGFAAAQSYLGNAYYLGIGIPEDNAEAVKWWLQAADQGDAMAQYSLARAHALGEGLPQDDVQAFMWLSIAAQRWTPHDTEARVEADSLLESLAEQITLAQIAEARRLAGEWEPGERPRSRPEPVESEAADRLFEKGLEAVQRDDNSTAMVRRDEISTAREAWEPLAEQGYRVDVSQLGQIDAKAQTSMVIIGLVAYDVAFVSKDYALPLMVWQPLAELGNAEAQFNLGLLYSQGLGVPKDIVLAHMLFDLSSAELGASAAKSRDDLAANMTPDQLAEAQRLARAWKPAAER